MPILFQGPVIVKSLTLGTLIMIVLTFFTSRISHFNRDIFMVIIFQVCSLCLGVRRIDNLQYLATVFQFGIILTPLWSPEIQMHAIIPESMHAYSRRVNFVFSIIIISSAYMDFLNGTTYVDHTAMFI